MARNRVKLAKGNDSSKSSKGKFNVTQKKTERKTGIRKCKMNISYRDLLDPCEGYVNQKEAEAFRVLFHNDSKASLDKTHFNSILRVAEKVIHMSPETFNSGSILATVCSILGALSPHCDSEDTLKQIETIVTFTKQMFTSEMIEKTIRQVPFDLRDKAITLFKCQLKQPQQVNATEHEDMFFRTDDLKSTDEEPNVPSTSKQRPGLMRQILQLFQQSEDEAVKQLIALRFQAFKVQCGFDEIQALGEVIRVLLSVNPERENLHLTFDCLVWMHKLSNKSQKRRELTRAVASDFCKRRGTLWVVKWIAENAEAADLPVGLELVVNSLEKIDLSSECISELLKKNDFVPALQKSIARRFSDFDIEAKEDLVNQIVNYLGKEDLSRETNLNLLIGDLLVNLLWMTYYDQRSLFDLLSEVLHGLTVGLNENPSFKTVALLYSWFKTGTINPILVDHVRGKTFWFCERSSLLFFEFCLSVTEPHFVDSFGKEFKKFIHSYVFNPGGALFLQYILCPPPIAFNDTLKRRTQEERLTTIESLRKALIPCLCARINEMPVGVCLWSEARCLLTSKLIMNLNDPKMLRKVVKKITDFVFNSMTRTLNKTNPWIFRLLRENIAMDAYLYSVQMSDEETEYFSDMFLDFFPSEAFVKHTRILAWRSLVLMLINTGIPSVLSKVKNRLTHLKPPRRMKSSEEIEFWQTVSDLD